MATSLADPAASAAILIGGSTYRDARFPPLPSVANNVADLRAVLTDITMWGLIDEHLGVRLFPVGYYLWPSGARRGR